MSTTFNDTVFHIRWPDAQIAASPLQTHRINLPSTSCPFSCAQRAQSYSTMYLSGLLHCQYLPSSTEPEEQRLERLFNLWPYASAKGTFATCLKKQMQRRAKRFDSSPWPARSFYILRKSPRIWNEWYHHKAAPVFCGEKGRLSCFAAAEQKSVVRSQAKGAAVVGHFLIGSSNPAVQGPFVNRKHC